MVCPICGNDLQDKGFLALPSGERVPLRPRHLKRTLLESLSMSEEALAEEADIIAAEEAAEGGHHWVADPNAMWNTFELVGNSFAGRTGSEESWVCGSHSEAEVIESARRIKAECEASWAQWSEEEHQRMPTAWAVLLEDEWPRPSPPMVPCSVCGCAPCEGFACLLEGV